jgi:Protein of unknown function (DUF3037)
MTTRTCLTPAMTKLPYTYTVLRYLHDVAGGEHVNVGVLVFSREARYLDIRLRDNDARVLALFPDLDRAAFRDALDVVGRGVAALAADAFLNSVYADAGDVGRAVVPTDDSALQWSPTGSGIASDMHVTSEHLYRRLVVRYDSPCG